MQITINKTGKAIDLEVTALPTVTQEYIINYGIRQILNDCHSSVQQKDFDSVEAWHEAVNATVQKKIEALQAGTISVRSAGTREPVDPIAKLVHRMAKEIVTAAIRAEGVKVKDIAPEKFAELLSNYIAKNSEALTKEAKVQLKKSESLEVNLEDLGL